MCLLLLLFSSFFFCFFFFFSCLLSSFVSCSSSLLYCLLLCFLLLLFSTFFFCFPFSLLRLLLSSLLLLLSPLPSPCLIWSSKDIASCALASDGAQVSLANSVELGPSLVDVRRGAGGGGGGGGGGAGAGVRAGVAGEPCSAAFLLLNELPREI